MEQYFYLVCIGIMTIGVVVGTLISYKKSYKKSQERKKAEMVAKHWKSLHQLEALKNMGLVDDEQYNTVRSEILDNLNKLKSEVE